MKKIRARVQCLATMAACALLLAAVPARAQSDPLPSWNSGAAKQAILSFVKATTDKSSARYVQPRDRVATARVMPMQAGQLNNPVHRL